MEALCSLLEVIMLIRYQVTHPDSLKERVRGLSGPVFVEVTLQKNVGRFVDVEAGDPRKGDRSHLLQIEASGAPHKVLNSGPT